VSDNAHTAAKTTSALFTNTTARTVHRVIHSTTAVRPHSEFISQPDDTTGQVTHYRNGHIATAPRHTTVCTPLSTCILRTISTTTTVSSHLVLEHRAELRARQRIGHHLAHRGLAVKPVESTAVVISGRSDEHITEIGDDICPNTRQCKFTQPHPIFEVHDDDTCTKY
jgi:hypothetical protein